MKKSTIFIVLMMTLISISCSKITETQKTEFEEIREKWKGAESILTQTDLNNLPFGAIYQDSIIVWNELSINCPRITDSRTNIDHQSNAEYQIIIFIQQEEANNPYSTRSLFLINETDVTPEEIQDLYLIDIRKINNYFILKMNHAAPGTWTEYWMKTSDFQNFRELGWYYPYQD